VIDLFELQHQPRRLAVGGVEHIGICDFGRPGEIEHDPRTARHDQAIAKRLDQPASGSAYPGGKLKADLGQVHDHPVRVGKRKSGELDGLVEIENEASLLAVAGQAGRRGDRKNRRDGRGGCLIFRRTGGSLGTYQCCGAH
jgi:hypothetical protein